MNLFPSQCCHAQAVVQFNASGAGRQLVVAHVRHQIAHGKLDRFAQHTCIVLHCVGLFPHAGRKRVPRNVPWA